MSYLAIETPGFWKRLKAKASQIWDELQPFAWLKDSSSWIEVFSGTMGWAWGILLLLPFDTFGATPSYIVMKWIAGEEVWAATFILVGLLHSLSVCAGFQRLRHSAALFGALVWMFVGTMFLLSIPIGIAPWIWLSLAGLLVVAGIKNADK